MQTQDERIRDAEDLDFDNPEPQNVDIFDDNKGGDSTPPTPAPNDDSEDTQDDQADQGTEEDDADEGIVIINESKNPKVRSSKPSSEFNNLLRNTLQDAKDAPLANYMHVQMLL